MRIWKMGATKSKKTFAEEPPKWRRHCSQAACEGNAQDDLTLAISRAVRRLPRRYQCRTPNIRSEDRLRRSGAARSKASSATERATAIGARREANKAGRAPVKP